MFEENMLRTLQPAPVRMPIEDRISRERRAIEDVSIELSDSLEGLHAHISQLEEVINPVLAEPSPIKEDGSLSQSQGSSQLYYKLNDLSQAVQRASNRITELKRRVEL